MSAPLELGYVWHDDKKGVHVGCSNVGCIAFLILLVALDLVFLVLVWRKP